MTTKMSFVIFGRAITWPWKTAKSPYKPTPLPPIAIRKRVDGSSSKSNSVPPNRRRKSLEK